jgi:hypothetical protein
VDIEGAVNRCALPRTDDRTNSDAGEVTDKTRRDEGDPVFRSSEFLAQGLTRAKVRAQLDAERWSRPLPRVVVRTNGALTLVERCLSALKYADGREPDSSFVSHETSAEWYGFGLPTSPDIHVSSTRGVRSRGFVVVHRVAAVPSRHVIVVDGIRLSSPARTLLDLSRRMPDEELTHSLARLLQRRVLARGYLVQELGYLPRWPGVVRLRSALQAVAGKRSGYEVIVIAGLAARGWFAEPNDNVPIPLSARTPGVARREGDAVFRAIRAVVQTQSIAHHTWLPDAARDAWRDLDFARASYLSIPVWCPDLDRRREEVLDAVAEALEARARELGVPLSEARGRPPEAEHAPLRAGMG